MMPLRAVGGVAVSRRLDRPAVGSLAKFTAIRRASSRVSSMHEDDETAYGGRPIVWQGIYPPLP
jgi:hypothetical protein